MNTPLRPFLAFLGFAAASASPSMAAAYTWTPTSAGTLDWNDVSSNWTSGFPNAIADTATFSATLTGAQTINLNQAITVGTLNLGGTSASNAYTIAAGTAGALTLQVSSGSATVNATTTGNVISANLTLGSNTTFTPSGGVVLEISGVIDGTRNLTRSGGGGTGNLYLSNSANTYTGSTTVGTGMLSVASLANGGVASSVGQSGNAASNLVISSGGNFIYGGASVASTDRLFTSSGATATIQNTGGGLNFTNTGAIAYGSADSVRALTFGGTGTSSLAPTIGDNGTAAVSVTKNGAGTWTLSGANSYTGATTISAGTLRAGVATNAFGANSAVTLANVSTAVLSLDGFSNRIGSLAGGGASGGNVSLGSATLTAGGDNTSTTYAGVISGTGGFTKTGTGTQTFSRASSYTGATRIDAGTLLLDATGSLAGASALIIANSAVFDVSAKSGYSLGTGGTTIGVGSSTAGFFNAGSAAMTFGNALTLNFSSPTLAASYNLFDFGSQSGNLASIALTGSITGSLLLTGADIWTGNAGGYDFSFSEVSGILSVTSASIPEPSGYALLLAGLTFAGASLRRRR